MDSNKFAQMVREFPFLTKIIHEEQHTDEVCSIEVRRGDRNLLEVTPAAWCHDADSYGEVRGFRSFWVVTVSGEIRKLDSAWTRTIPNHTNRQQPAPTVGAQLASYDKEVSFVVELHAEAWDTQDMIPAIVIYKMPISLHVEIQRLRATIGKTPAK